MNPICIHCGEIEDWHRSGDKACPALNGFRTSTKFTPAAIPKAPMGFVRSTWATYVRYHSRAENITIKIPVRDFLTSRDPRAVLLAAVNAHRPRR